MLQWVVLHHTLLDGSSHYDWLLESAADAPLLSLRVSAPLGPGSFPSERLPEHRRIYLTYEGDIGANRGSVKRVQQGHVLEVSFSAQTISALLTHGQTRLRLSATPHQVQVIPHSPT